MKWLSRGVLAALLFVGCAKPYKHPVDILSAESAPGQFGWIMADKKDPQGRWYRDVTVFARVEWPELLKDVGCVMTLTNGGKVTFPPNSTQSWVLQFPAGLGDHLVTIEVGDKKVVVPIHVFLPSS